MRITWITLIILMICIKLRSIYCCSFLFHICLKVHKIQHYNFRYSSFMSREHSKKWCNDYQRAGFKRPSNFLKKIILMANKMNPDWLWANCNMQYWRWWILQNIARASSYLQWGSHLVSNPNIEVLGPYRYFPLQGCASI